MSMLETTDKESIISRLETTILELTRQGFFCTVFYKGYAKDGKPIPFFPKIKTIVLPSHSSTRDVGIEPEEWQKIFKLAMWKQIDKVAIWCGNNGVLVFDFDVKHFAKDGKHENKEKYDKAWEIWDGFKEHLKQFNIPYYLESSRSGGEHLIVLCEPDVENLQPKYDICPALGIKFIECFAYDKKKDDDGKDTNKAGHLITIAPSKDYRQLSEVSLSNLKRISATDRTSIMSYFEKHQAEAKQKEERKKLEQQKEKKQQEKLKKQEAKEYKHKLTHIEIDRYVIQEYGYELIPELERMGYTRHGDRIARPGKSETDLQILDNGKKIKCYADTDILFNNGNPCDLVDILKINGEHHRLKELRREIIKRYSPHQMTTQIEKAETLEELYQAIQETCKDRLVMNVYESPDKSETILEVKIRDGSTRFFDLRDFLGQTLEQTGASFFEDSRHMTKAGTFAPLRLTILLEKGLAPRKLLLDHACWHEGRFCYKSSDELHIKTEYFSESKHSFEDWKTQIFDVGCKKPGTAIALLMGFAAPFVDILHQSFGVNFVGGSNIGKSTSIRICRGMFNNPKALETWESTVSALEAKRYTYANRVMCIDDMHKADCKTLTAITRIMGATHRDRAYWDGKNLTTAKSYSVQSLVMSSSEHSFREVAKRLEVPLAKGDINRFLDFHVTKDDFPSENEWNILHSKIENIHGVATARLCQQMESLDADLLVKQFEEFSKQYDEEVVQYSAALKRVIRHRIFLQFIAKLSGEILKIDTQEMWVHVKSLFDRFTGETKEILADGDAIELEAVRERISEMLVCSDYICKNEKDTRPHRNVCFFTQPSSTLTYTDAKGNTQYITETYCFRPKVASLLAEDLKLGKTRVYKILNQLRIFGKRHHKTIEPLGQQLNVHEILEAWKFNGEIQPE